MLGNLKFEVRKFLAHVRNQSEDEVKAIEEQRRKIEAMQKMEFNHPKASSGLIGDESDGRAEPEEQEPFVREGRKIGRNEPCPCGSGKKFKQCHGKLVDV